MPPSPRIRGQSSTATAIRTLTLVTNQWDYPETPETGGSSKEGEKNGRFNEKRIPSLVATEIASTLKALGDEGKQQKATVSNLQAMEDIV